MRQVVVILAICGFAVVTAAITQPSQAEILATTLLEDTFVQSSSATSNYRTADYLWVRNHSTVSRLALAQFRLPQLPSGMTPSSIGEVWISGTVYRSATANQELEVLVLGTDPDLTAVNYNDMMTAGVITGLTGNYNFAYGSGATLVDQWTVAPQGSSGTEPHYYRVQYVDDNSADGLLYWVQQTISDTGPTTLTVAFGPRGTEASCDFRFWSMEGAADSSNNPPAGFLPAIPLTLTLIPEPSAALLCVLALAGGLVLRLRRRRS